MKTTRFLQLHCMLLLLIISQTTYAFYEGGSIMGRVVDPDTKKPAADVTIVFESQGLQKVFNTNDNGYYYASNLPVGIYTITASFMSSHTLINNVRVNNDEQRVVDIAFNIATLDTVVITGERYPLINPVEPTKVTLTREDFKNEPIITLAGITAMQSGVTEVNGAFYVRGAREGQLAYYIDGGPAMANADIPLCGLETYTIYTGFIPPKYGDTVGGVVVLETRNYFAENH